ncbi:MAG: ribosome silencing factor [Rhizobacter sp.]
MDIKKLQRAIVDGLEDVKGQHIVVFDSEHLSSLFERVIIASGTSNRQTRSLAASVRDAVKGAGFPVPRVEGEENGEWIIVDCGAAVVHLMQQTIREYYHLEEIWGDKPVKLKMETQSGKLVKAAEPDVAPKAKAKPAAKKAAPATPTSEKKAAALAGPTKKVAAKKAAVKTATAKTAPAKKDAAKKVVAKKVTRVEAVEVAKPKAAAVKKAVLGKGGVSRTVGVKAAVPAAKKPAAKVAPVKKAAAKKAPAKKAAASKPVAKKASRSA